MFSLAKRRRFLLLLGFLLVALFIWIAENIATWSHAWLYPSQVNGWHMVSPDKLLSWFLLMIISVVLVAWVYKPVPPDEPVRRAVPRGSAAREVLRAAPPESAAPSGTAAGKASRDSPR